MQQQRTSWTSLKWTALGTFLLGLTLMQPASAGCLDMTGVMKKTNFRSEENGFGGRFIKTGFEGAEQDWESRPYRAPIVGLWAFKYIAGAGSSLAQEGTQVDGGNTLWFADGNEVTYSAIRNPTTGATCLGVWKQTGRYTYELNHVGVSWDPTYTKPMGGSTGPAFIKQFITLAPDAMSYTGTFEISQLEKDGKTLVPNFPIKGTIKAVRVTLETNTQTLPTSGSE